MLTIPLVDYLHTKLRSIYALQLKNDRLFMLYPSILEITRLLVIFHCDSSNFCIGTYGTQFYPCLGTLSSSTTQVYHCFHRTKEINYNNDMLWEICKPYKILENRKRT